MEPVSPDVPLRLYEPRSQVRLPQTDVARPCVPCIDAHNHLGRWLSRDWMTPDVGALISLMDEHDVAAIVNLDGRWGKELDANLDRYDRAHPGRFFTFCHLDWSVLDSGDASARLVEQLEDAARRGPRGLKVWKDLGLTVRDADGQLVLPDDARLSDAFSAAGELGLPVLMHTADPAAFFAPIDRYNERLEELAAHPDWWFGGDGMPPLSRLLDAFETVVAAHPETSFIGAHAGNCAEDLAWVGRLLDTYPNFTIDIAARLGELGRQPRATRRLILSHPDRVLFGTDCFPPSGDEYALHFRFLESDDEHFDYAPGSRVPPQGRWRISAIDLPREVLELVYAGNARRLLRITE